jgi:hypothetical protein
MTRIDYEVDLRRMLCKNENMLRLKAEKYSFVSSVAKEGIPCLRSMDVFTKFGNFYEARLFLRSMDTLTKHKSFSLRSMKRRKGVFRRRLKNGMYIKFHASQRTELQIIYILD